MNNVIITINLNASSTFCNKIKLSIAINSQQIILTNISSIYKIVKLRKKSVIHMLPVKDQIRNENVHMFQYSVPWAPSLQATSSQPQSIGWAALSHNSNPSSCNPSINSSHKLYFHIPFSSQVVKQDIYSGYGTRNKNL